MTTRKAQSSAGVGGARSSSPSWLEETQGLGGQQSECPASAMDALFFPKRVAVVGYSEKDSAWGHRVVNVLRHGGYRGEIVALRPRVKTTDVRCISEIGEAGPVDVMVVAVPAEAAVSVVGEASQAKVGAAIVFSAGFAETGSEGCALQEKLVEAAGGMVLLGPNCLGVVSAAASLRLSASGYMLRPAGPVGPCGLVTQSGALGFVLAELLEQRGIGYSYYASTGNEASLTASTIGRYLISRADVQTVGMYLEEVRDPKTYLSLGREASAAGKNVVVLKAGLSQASQRAVMSHTAAVAADHLLFRGASEEVGIRVVDNEEEFVEAVHVLQRPLGLKEHLRLGVITMSGGAGALMADELAKVGVIVPELQPDTRQALERTPNAIVSMTNPVDLGGKFAQYLDGLEAVADAVAADSGIDAVVGFFTFGERLRSRFDKLARHMAAMGKPGWFVWAGAPPGAVSEMASLGRAFPSVASFVRGLAQYPKQVPPEFEEVEVAGPPLLSNELTGRVTAQLQVSSIVGEGVFHGLLEDLGVPYVPTASARLPEELLESVKAAGIGPPFVLKVDTDAIAHRARHNLVVRAVADFRSLRSSAKEILARAENLGISSASTGLLAQPDIPSIGAFGIGAIYDRVYGPMLVAGPGGVRVESRRSSRVSSSLPLSTGGLFRVTRMLEHETGCDIEPREIAVLASALYEVLGLPGVDEVELNPVLVLADQSLVVVDCLAISQARSPGSARYEGFDKAGQTSLDEVLGDTCKSARGANAI